MSMSTRFTNCAASFIKWSLKMAFTFCLCWPFLSAATWLVVVGLLEQPFAHSSLVGGIGAAATVIWLRWFYTGPAAAAPGHVGSAEDTGFADHSHDIGWVRHDDEPKSSLDDELVNPRLNPSSPLYVFRDDDSWPHLASDPHASGPHASEPFSSPAEF